VRPFGLLLAAAAALPGPGAAVSSDWELSAELGAGFDSNATRATAPDPAERTPFLGATARARGALRDGGLRGTAAIAEAGRFHQRTPGAAALASRLEAEGTAALGSGLSAGLTVAASDLRDQAGLLARHALRGDASLSLGGRALGLSLSGGWSLFTPRAEDLRSLAARGPQAGLRGWWSPSPAHLLGLSGSVWLQVFPRWDPALRRADTTSTATLEYVYRGPFLGALEWETSRNRSGAPGGDYQRNRVTGQLATWLPLDLTLAGRVALQRSRYPAPLRLRDQLLVAEGGEGQDMVELRVARRLGERWEIAAAAAHYRNEAASGSGAPSFRRTVASLLLGWRARSEPGD